MRPTLIRSASMAFGVTPSFAHIARPAGRDVFGRQILAAPSIGTMLALSIVRKMSKLISSVRATCHDAPAAGGDLVAVCYGA